MPRLDQITHGPWRLIAVGLAVALVATVPVTANAAATPSAAADGPGRPDPVTRWVARHAVPLATVDPAAPLDDLAPLRCSIGDAAIVGLGESVHGAAEEITLKHRVLRALVQQGFRTVAWEDDWSVGRRIDEWIRGGDGDLDALVAQMSPQWQSRQVADVLAWLRDFNAGRPDPVRFIGVEHHLTGQAASDDLEAHVAAAAPDQLDAVRRHLQVLRPATPDVFAHIQWYQAVPDKEPYLAEARALVALVDGLPHEPGDLAHELAVRQARQILSFSEHFARSAADALTFREDRAAEVLRWWRDLTGDDIVYWAASPHTAVAPDLRIVGPPEQVMAVPSVGSHLRAWYGDRYRSIGFTFDHGTVSLGPGETVELAPPAAAWFERPLGGVGLDQFAVDLRRPAPRPVRAWLEAPVTTRGLSDGGPDAHITGGTLDAWFDVIVHRQTVTPVAPV